MTLLLALLACTPDDGALVDDGSLARITEGSAEAFGVLGLLNHEDTTLALLDDDVGLDVRAATSLIEHRDGADGVFGTDDDDTYQTIAEVDDQYYVGDRALQQLLDYAQADGWVPGPDDVVGSWEGVSFTASQVEGVLALVNDASQETLDDDVGLDSRAAQGIVDERPFADIQTLADVSWVGPSALTKLQDYAEMLTLADVGEQCNTDDDCQDDLRCMGSIAYGAGIMCVDTWDVFSWEGPETIPDDGTPLDTTVEVTGLASVPVDVVLTIEIDHDRPSDLVLEISNFNGYGTTLWEGGSDQIEMELVVRAFPSDDEVHGEYTVTLTDEVAGIEGELVGWDLLIVSTYD